MRLLTAGSLVRVQQVAPKQSPSVRMGFVLALFAEIRFILWLTAARLLTGSWPSRRRWRMKGGLEQEETQSDASESAMQRDNVSDRTGRWFESNRWRQKKSATSVADFFIQAALAGWHVIKRARTCMVFRQLDYIQCFALITFTDFQTDLLIVL